MSSKIRVLHVYSGNLYGGIETLLLTLATNSHCCPGMELEFALCFEALLSRELKEVAKVHLLGAVRLRFPWSWASARRRLKRVLRHGNFDAVICHSPWSQTIFGPVVRRFGLPLVFSMHDATDGTFWLERLSRQIRPDLILCNSRFTTATISSFNSGIPTSYIYWPVAGQSEAPSSTRRQLRAELGTSDTDIVIIQVSRLERWKGHLLHLEALSRIAHVPDWTCWQVGGPQKEGEKEYLADLKACAVGGGIDGRVRFLGQRNDVAALLAAADIHCQPNTGPEPFGRTYIEALGAGLPVISTKIGAAVEIVDCSCGILVPPDDTEALAEALREVVSSASLRLSYGLAGRARAKQLCDPETQLDALRKILTSIMPESRAA